MMSKQYTFILGLFFISHAVSAEDRYLKWIDPKTETRFRIDIDSFRLIKEVVPGNWKTISKLIVDSLDFNHIPSKVINSYFFFDNGNRIRFTIDGSGHVFDYFPLKLELRRVDNTFHSGFNYASSKFVRNGLIYSIGGEGFWNHNNTITYFDDKLKEWEILRPKNSGPNAVCEGYQGYDSKSDVYYSGAPHITYSFENQNTLKLDELFKFDFKKNRWLLLGKINPQLPPLDQQAIIWSGTLFFQIDRSNIFIINPARNEVRVFKDYRKVLVYFKDYIVKNDTIIGFKEINSGSSLKISISEISKNSTYFGEFYYSRINTYWYYASALLLSCVAMFFVWKYKTSFNAKNLNFTKVEKRLLHKLLLLKPKEYLTTHDINDILDASDKSQENQRRIRYNVIGQLNNKLRLQLGSKNGIERKSLPEDKRLTVYVLDPHIISDLRRLLKQEMRY
jgi:hypothetical protein